MVDGAAIEQAALRAWPADEEERNETWLLRANGGYTKRANSAYALESADSTELSTLRTWYAARGLPLVIRESSLCPNPALSQELARRSFRRFDETLIMTGNTGGDIDQRMHQAELEPWIGAYTQFEGATKGDQRRHAKLVTSIPGHVLTAVLTSHDRAVACGLAVVEGPHMGLFDIATDQSQRRMGYGRSLVQSMLAWGAMQGAAIAYLQVLERNSAAIALYQGLGFREAYRNWYWIQQ